MSQKRCGDFIMPRQILSAIVLVLVFQSNAMNAYASLSKEHIFADVFLAELLNRMDKDMDSVNANYYDLDADLPKSLDLVSRSSSKSNAGFSSAAAAAAAGDDFEYRNLFDGGASHPSIRDQEYLQHSSLWGHQYVSGGMGEIPNRYNTIVKTDSSLPAYCNPPNPCPFGYDESQGCISDFENTAIFSREFQAAQECTCDSEHMFDCANQDSGANNNDMTSTMEKFLMHQFQNENGIDSSNSNAVVKKFYGFLPMKEAHNPFLQGEKLPIAAKKGNLIPA